MVDRNRRQVYPGNGDFLTGLKNPKLNRRPGPVHKRDLLKVRPYMIVKDEISERRDYFFKGVDDYRTIKQGECFGDVYGKRGRMIAVRMSDYDGANSAHLVGRERKANAAAVNGQTVINYKGSQRLQLRLPPGAAWQ